jgi:tRNA(Ile)-lysidine synthase
MALALLASDWAASQKGRVVALTVDHGLRAESAAEARLVGRRLKARGIPHRILTWQGGKPRTGIQEAARAARYRLLFDWCRARGILHLLTAHTLDDQAETFLLRLGRGSGADGLAAMPLVSEGPDVRLLRPLLTLPKARLIATLKARGQDWIEDPSNRDTGFARVRVRGLLSGLEGRPAGAARIASAARAMGEMRAARERLVAALLARAAAVSPAGYIELDASLFQAAGLGVAMRVLARCLLCVSGRANAARGKRLDRLLADLMRKGPKRAQTLGGCRIVPELGKFLICREPARAELRLVPDGGLTMLWDGRFRIALASRPAKLRLGPLGNSGWAEILRHAPGLRASPIPAAARLALLAASDSNGVAAVPQLGFRRDFDAKKAVFRAIAWQPSNPLTSAGFSVAKSPARIIS